jgi:hypothetical protein
MPLPAHTKTVGSHRTNADNQMSNTQSHPENSPAAEQARADQITRTDQPGWPAPSDGKSRRPANQSRWDQDLGCPSGRDKIPDAPSLPTEHKGHWPRQGRDTNQPRHHPTGTGTPNQGYLPRATQLHPTSTSCHITRSTERGDRNSKNRHKRKHQTYNTETHGTASMNHTQRTATSQSSQRRTKNIQPCTAKSWTQARCQSSTP